MIAGPILIMAGGTGGHVFPALALAERLRSQAAEVVWLGTRRGLEARVVPAAGIQIEWVSVGALRGRGLLSWSLAPFRLIYAVQQCLRIVLRRRPAAVVGLGGFVAGPGGLAAWLMRRPLVIHEQNAVAGLTNRVLARLASKVLEAFPGSFPAAVDAVCIGNPVRHEIAAIPTPDERLAERQGPARLLVFGGSQGASRLNTVVPQALSLLPQGERPQVWHQSGGRRKEEAETAYRDAGVDVRLSPFIDDMASAYQWADLVICRAGALTIFELAAAGLASILVPFPFAVDDHQSLNAGYLVEARAAVMIPETELSPARLADELKSLLSDRVRLIDMARRARSLATPDSATELTDACLAAAGASG